MAYKRSSNFPQGVDISQHQRSLEEEQLTIVDQMTLTLANFALVQVGRRPERISVTDLELCRGPGCEQLQLQSLEKLKDEVGNIIPNDVCNVLSNSSSMLEITPTLRNGLTNADTDWQISENRNRSAETQINMDCQLKGVEYCIPLIKKHGSLKGKRCEVLLKTLEELQDNGRFEAHEALACNSLELFTDSGKVTDMEASLKIARGVAFYYANKHRASRKLYKDVIRNMGETLQNRDLLHGRAYVKLATTYRYEKKFGKAIQCLQKAQGLLRHHEPGEDTAELYYYYGVSWLDVYWNSLADEEGRQVFKARAKQYFERAIDHSIRDERPRVQLKRKVHFHLRVAALHLDSGTRAARETRQIANEDIKEAKKHLDFVEYQLSDGIRPGHRIQLLKTRSDQHYREGKICLAKETAQEALSLAKQIHRNMEIIPLELRIEERVKFLDSPLLSRVTTEHYPSDDSGWSADVSGI